jgi:nitrate reductase NapE component
MPIHSSHLRRIGRRFLPLAAAVALIVGLSVAALDRAPAVAMPAARPASVELAPTAVQKAQWAALHAPAETETETATAQLLGVGILALGLAGAFGVILMMFDQMMRTRSGGKTGGN